MCAAAASPTRPSFEAYIAFIYAEQEAKLREDLNAFKIALNTFANTIASMVPSGTEISLHLKIAGKEADLLIISGTNKEITTVAIDQSKVDSTYKNLATKISKIFGLVTGELMVIAGKYSHKFIFGMADSIESHMRTPRISGIDRATGGVGISACSPWPAGGDLPLIRLASTEELTSLTTQLEKTKKKSDEHHKELLKAREELIRLNATIDTLKKELSEARSKANKGTAITEATAAKEKHILIARIENLTAQLEIAEARTAAANAENLTLIAHIETLTTQLKTAEASLVLERTEAETRIAVASKTAAHAKEEAQHIKASTEKYLDTVSSEIISLKAEIFRLSKNNAKLAADLKTAEREKDFEALVILAKMAAEYVRTRLPSTATASASPATTFNNGSSGGAGAGAPVRPYDPRNY
jgi:hypothetical protein